MAASALQFVDIIDPQGEPTEGLVPVDAPHPSRLSIDEQAAVFEARSLDNVDFVFFRRFSDGRSSQISAYVVNNADCHLTAQDLSRVHLRLWLHGAAPLLYVSWPSRVDVLSCARGPDFWENGKQIYKPAQMLETAGEVDAELKKRFSVFRLADGTFWEDPGNARFADHSESAYQSLIQAVVEADQELKGNKNPLLRRLLLLTVLIKYLEDRRVFPDSWFAGFHKGAKTFFEVLQGGNPADVYRLLDFLERQFNGDIFLLPREKSQRLTKKNLERFADLVETRTLNRQRYLWDQFSFEHLPVEIISHLYQRFVQDGHGAVYTPPFLASLLLDHCMPYDKLSGVERILDPACGSGVFLVGAFRRLVNFWRSRNNWERPQVDMLKQILSQSVYGIELDPSAVDLTAFSLCLAICDALKPDVIWRDLKFDPLRGTNLFEADSFRLLVEARDKSSGPLAGGFDVIVGNPPFESRLTPAAKEVDQAVQRLSTDRGSLPDKQAAYLFLEQFLEILRPHGRLCLIQPSGFLYNRNTERFRTSIFRRHRTNTLLDFVSIRNLYEADSKTVAIFAYAEMPPEGHVIDHWTFRRTVSVEERISFELDHYDHHRVQQHLAVTDPYVWRGNLLGGGRLLDIARRLRGARTLAKYIKMKGWDYGEGFIAAKEGKRTPAPFLTGKPFLPTRAFTDSGIDESQIATVTETHFRSAYTKDRFNSPRILIKETDSLPVAFWDKGFIAYRDKIVGIHAAPAEVPQLRDLYEALRKKREIYRFSCAVNGTQQFAGKATAILKQDIDMLPYPEDVADLSFSYWENAIIEDVLEYMTEYVRMGQNSKLLRRAADVADLHRYSGMFCRMLGTVYSNLRPADPVFLDGLISQSFFFGDQPSHSRFPGRSIDKLRQLVYSKQEHLRTVRLLRFYTENVLLLVKPDRLRYWLPSVAIRDADETLVDLRQRGY